MTLSTSNIFWPNQWIFVSFCGFLQTMCTRLNGLRLWCVTLPSPLHYFSLSPSYCLWISPFAPTDLSSLLPQPYLVHCPSPPLGYVSTCAEWLPSSGRWAGRIFGFHCFHLVCFHYGGAEAERRWVSPAGPLEWVLEPFYRPAIRSSSGLETIDH